MTIIFTLSFLAVFFMAFALFSIPMSSRAQVKKSLSRLASYEVSGHAGATGELNFQDRIIWPLLEKLSTLAKRWNTKERIARTHKKLMLAGIRNLSAEKFETIKLALAGIAFLIFLLFGIPFFVVSGNTPWLGLPLVGIVFYFPTFWLGQRIERRQKQIGATLADSIDILKIGVEAGLVFDSALAKVAQNMDGALSEEFGRVLGELQIGVTRSQALNNLSDRTNIPELQSFCATLIQADKLGVSISKILQNEASDLRIRRRQAAEEAALKTPVKIVFPVVLCILPALLIVIMGPASIRIMNTLFTVF